MQIPVYFKYFTNSDLFEQQLHVVTTKHFDIEHLCTYIIFHIKCPMQKVSPYTLFGYRIFVQCKVNFLSKLRLLLKISNEMFISVIALYLQKLSQI